jgi:glycerophosphoryl diester phosphodiesterase/HEAT repeat protein
MRDTKLILIFFLTMTAAHTAHGEVFQRGKVQLMCHRTANADMPENTIESLKLAARMGCNIVEIDLTRTLDGKIVLHHDGLLERLSDGMGIVEETYSQELALMDAGSWMGSRFGALRIPLFEDALRVARECNIALYLDFKSKGIGPQVITLLKREGMLDKVRFGGEWEDVKAIYPQANEEAVISVSPDATPQQIQAAHRDGKIVVADFFANHHEMDFEGMRAAVAAGIDGLFVDYPRIGADAVGRPVEAKLAALIVKANEGIASDRAAAIFEIAQYDGFPTEKLFERWLLDGDDKVSRAAAIALITSQPPVRASSLQQALDSGNVSSRKNAAWAMGMLRMPADPLLPLLNDQDLPVLQETLLALSRCTGTVPANKLLPFLSNPSPLIRGAAALALARHQPEAAAVSVPAVLKKDEQFIAEDYAHYTQRGKPKLTQQEIAPIVIMYRGQMKLVQAGEQLPEKDALTLLESQAFRSVEDYSLVAGLVSGYQLWDRISKGPSTAITALSSTDPDIANRAEWILVKAGPDVLPQVREALQSEDAQTRERIIRILAWQGDGESVASLRSLAQSHPEDDKLIEWAIEKIHAFNVGFLPKIVTSH